MKKVLFIAALILSNIICVSSVSASQHETTYPIVAQYFGIWTEKGQKWGEKFREETPFKKLNRLYIAFAKIAKNRNGHFYLKFQGGKERVTALLKRMKEVNPSAEIFIAVTGDGGLQSLGGAAQDDQFAENAKTFLAANGFDGIDINWVEDLKQRDLSTLIMHLYTVLHPAGYKLTLAAWQYVSPGYNIPYIKDYLDQINIMSYGTGIDLAVCVHDYVLAGFPAEKIIGGVETEVDYRQFGGVTDTLGMRGTIKRKAEFALRTKLAGMMGWRLDNDYALKYDRNVPSYQGAITLWEAMILDR